MNSISLIGILPDDLVLWVQFGTRMFVDYLYILVGIPLLVDLAIVLSTRFGFQLGGSAGDEPAPTETAASESGVGGPGGSVALDDAYKFMYVYARNPGLFETRQGAASLDASLAGIQQLVTGTSSVGVAGAGGKSAGASGGTGPTGDTSVGEAREQGGTKSRSYLSTFVVLLHTVCLVGILAVNVIGYVQYSNLFHKYYTLTKYGYNLKYSELENAPRDEHDEALHMEPFVEILNDIKYSTAKAK